jgi:hypothetical protein
MTTSCDFLASCPVCHVSVLGRKLFKHLRRVHKVYDLDDIRCKREISLGPSRPGLAKTEGFGGYPNDCCQSCGIYLFTECYSKNKTAERVPRTNKICRKCHGALPPYVQLEYQRYKYQHGPEIPGRGWNANKC